MVSPEEDPNWIFDYGLIDDVPVPSLQATFNWPSHDFTASAALGIYPFGSVQSYLKEPCFTWILTSDVPDWLYSLKKTGCWYLLQGFMLEILCLPSDVEFDDSPVNLDDVKENHSRKRHDEVWTVQRIWLQSMSGEKLGSILEPGRPPKMDKAVILSDALRMMTQLRSEGQKLKKSCEDLQEKINELKAEKNELRDEKQRLKTEKENIVQQIKALSSQAGFLPHPSAIPAPFAAPGQVVGSKLMPFIGYPGVSMWQFMPPAAVDTSQDHVLRPQLLKFEGVNCGSSFPVRKA
ncbi:Transcription factor ILR3 [Vitis vinifera]|uniref:Transcription factor ILR3 n=1 Tax=Vitis vinifera TaxID=29760 RepID=A0A438HPM4_VITVI|nr:Transcription factor ILR3 [Vitis vinifera]